METSLALLIPKYRKYTGRPKKFVYKPSATATELEDRSRAAINIINTRDYSAAGNLIAPGFKATYDDLGVCNFTEHLDTVKMLQDKNPGYRVDVVATSADVDEQAGYGIVFILLEISGRPANLRRQSVSVAEWMRRKEGWQLYHVSGMRGMTGHEIPGHV